MRAVKRKLGLGVENNVEAARAPYEISVFVFRIVLTVLNNLPSGSNLNSTAAINEPYVKKGSRRNRLHALLHTTRIKKNR